MPFVGFAEAFVFTALRRAKVKDRRIREGVEAIRKQHGVHFALASKLLWTDHSELLLGDEGSDLTVARTGQGQFSVAVKERLIPITYADDGYAKRIKLPQFAITEVVVDPAVAFGNALIEPAGAPINDVIGRWWAGDSMEALAEDYGVPLASVEEVIRAQTRKPQGIPTA